MTAGLTKKTFGILALGGFILLAVLLRAEDPKIGQALLAGYILFSFNYLLIARIYAGLVSVSQSGHASARLKGGLMLGTGLKFLGLIAALYTLIVLWQLPGLYIALGSLLSLFLLTSLLFSSYVKSMGSTTPPQGM